MSPDPLARTSWSSFSQFVQCGEAWRRRRVVGETENPSWAAVGGKAFHLVTERWDDHDYKSELGYGDWWDWGTEFGDALDQCIREEVSSSGVPPELWRVSGRATAKWPGKETEDFWRAEGPVMGQAYETWRMENPGYTLWRTPDGRVANELELRFELAGTPVLAYVDRIYHLGDALIVVDLKSGRNMPDVTLQLQLYAAAVARVFGPQYAPQKGAYYNARKGTIGYPEDMTFLRPEDLDALFETFLYQAERQQYMPRPGVQCTWCSFAPTCKWSSSLGFGLRSRIAS